MIRYILSRFGSPTLRWLTLWQSYLKSDDFSDLLVDDRFASMDCMAVSVSFLMMAFSLIELLRPMIILSLSGFVLSTFNSCSICYNFAWLFASMLWLILWSVVFEFKFKVCCDSNFYDTFAQPFCYCVFSLCSHSYY